MVYMHVTKFVLTRSVRRFFLSAIFIRVPIKSEPPTAANLVGHSGRAPSRTRAGQFGTPAVQPCSSALPYSYEEHQRRTAHKQHQS
eukprot:scaffold177291_cov45-Prasinocladus_malaysianus.AAC.1